MAKIIAEIGSNWKTFEQCMNGIALAKNCGADAVKFQMFSPMEMFGHGSTIYRGIDREWLPKLKEKADACKIEFMCTAFSEDGIEAVDPFVSAHKIASSDLTHLPMLVAAKSKGKKIYLSTGASGWQDIANALEVLKGADVTLMYCSSEYPSRWHNLRLINVLRSRFDVDVGYSDHSIDGYTSSCAVHIHGATAVEKHFNPHALSDTPDHFHSVTPDLFKYMVDCIKDPEHAMKMPNPGEVDMIKRHNRRMIVTEPVKKGDVFEYGKNYGLYRSIKEDVDGYSGWHIKAVDGNKSTQDLEIGDSIGPKQVEQC